MNRFDGLAPGQYFIVLLGDTNFSVKVFVDGELTTTYDGAVKKRHSIPLIVLPGDQTIEIDVKASGEGAALLLDQFAAPMMELEVGVIEDA